MFTTNRIDAMDLCLRHVQYVHRPENVVLQVLLFFISFINYSALGLGKCCYVLSHEGIAITAAVLRLSSRGVPYSFTEESHQV